MMKKITTFLLAVLMIISILPVSAFAASSVTWAYDGGNLTISGTGAIEDYTASSPAPWSEYTHAITNVVIGSGITAIGSEAFAGMNSLRTVTIPATVTSIGDYAFYRCDTLTALTIPSAVTAIGDYAFYGCGDLTTLTIPNNVTSIGEGAFAACDGLTSVTIGTGVTTIGSYAFHGCSGLKTVSIPAAVTSIGDSAFEGCASLTGIQVDGSNTSYASDSNGILYSKDLTTLLRAPNTLSGSFTVPSSVTAIAAYAFYGCSALTEVNIPSSVTTVNTEAFGSCPSLTGIWVDETSASFSSDENGILYSKGKTSIHRVPATLSGSYIMPDTVRLFANHAFDGCADLTSVTLSANVTSIAESTFEGCTGLTSITIPEKVAALYPYAFRGCTGLTELVIPESVFAIGREAFADCSALSNVRFADSAPSFESNVFYGVTATVEYPQYDSSWTSERMLNYGGSLTWVSYHEHSYSTVIHDATCMEYETYELTCANCGDTYTLNAGEMTATWIEEIPEGLDASLFTSKTQYRYSDYETTTSYATSLDGYTQKSSTWEESGSGTVTYVPSWPSGFSTSSSLYTTYNKASSKVSESQTTTEKTVIDSDDQVGYLYYHWCYSGSTYSTESSSGSYTTFHAFYSTTTPPTTSGYYDSSDCSHKMTENTVCSNSNWFFHTDVYTQSYTTYKKLFTYERWTDYTDWSDTAVTASTTRKVETRTVYQLKSASLGDHAWDNGAVTTAATCTADGVRTYTCSVCSTTKTEPIAATGHSYSGGSCTVCGAADPNAVPFILAGANMVLGGILEMNFFINQTDISGTGYYAVITHYAANGTRTVTVPYSEWGTYGPYYMVTLEDLEARQMADKIEVVIYKTDGTKASETWTDSVRDYTMRTYAARNEEGKTLLVDMLNYGAAAQTFFGYNATDLANNQLTTAQQAKATASVSCTDQRTYGSNYVGSTLVLESRIILTVLFQDLTTDMYAVVSYTDHYGESKTVRVEGSDFVSYYSYYGIQVDDLVVADGNQLVNVTICNANGTPVAWASDSMNSYAARNLSKDPIYEMVAKFTASAYAYFH